MSMNGREVVIVEAVRTPSAVVTPRRGTTAIRTLTCCSVRATRK